MTRIMIEWNHCYDKEGRAHIKHFQPSGDEVEGIVTIGEGSEAKKLSIHLSRSSEHLKPIKGARVLPELTDEEDEAFRMMAEAYFAGLSRQDAIVRWIGREPEDNHPLESFCDTHSDAVIK